MRLAEIARDEAIIVRFIRRVTRIGGTRAGTAADLITIENGSAYNASERPPTKPGAELALWVTRRNINYKFGDMMREMKRRGQEDPNMEEFRNAVRGTKGDLIIRRDGIYLGRLVWRRDESGFLIDPEQADYQEFGSIKFNEIVENMLIDAFNREVQHAMTIWRS